MIFKYRILGRTPGCPEARSYAGTVDAGTPNEAIIKSLANEFADRASSQADAAKALVASGWVELETLSLALEALQDDDTHFCLDLGDLMFDVAIELMS
jgi:hypothetical protein